MKLPIEILRKLDEFVGSEEEHILSPRETAIIAAAKLLISITHDEHYNNTDAYSSEYDSIADACTAFIER